MLAVRRAADRGHFNHGWLDTYHTFSFADYHDPSHMGFRALRVINEDRVAPGQGFGTHPHRDMEIVTYVLEGALTHRDSLGTGSTIRAGELQRITAGTGITHSEFNASGSEPVHLYQIWLFPDRRGHTPSYEQRAFAGAGPDGSLLLVAAPDGRDGALTIHQDAALYLAKLEEGQEVAHRVAPGRHAWLQVLRGSGRLDGHDLSAGDGVAAGGVESVEFKSSSPAEILLFDLP